MLPSRSIEVQADRAYASHRAHDETFSWLAHNMKLGYDVKLYIRLTGDTTHAS